jgi:hypothetical protein
MSEASVATAPAVESPAPAQVQAEQPTTQQQSAESYLSDLTASTPSASTMFGAPQQQAAAQGAEQPATEDPRYAEYGLDPKNVAHQRLLQQMSGGSASAEEHSALPSLSDVEAVLLAGITSTQQDSAPAKPTAAGEPQGAAATPNDAAAPDQGNSSFNDGFTWQNVAEAYETLNQAWNADDKELYGKASQALFDRNLHARVAPVLVEYERRIAELSQQIQEIAPHVKNATQEVERQSAYEQVHRAIKFDQAGQPRKGMESFDLMFESPKDGAVVEIDGNKIPATPINKIIAANPWIMKIREEDPNPKVATRKTLWTQYTAAYDLFRKQQSPVKPLTPAVASQLFEAGQQAARTTPIPARQAITAPGATINNPSASAQDNYLAELLASGGANSIFS